MDIKREFVTIMFIRADSSLAVIKNKILNKTVTVIKIVNELTLNRRSDMLNYSCIIHE